MLADEEDRIECVAESAKVFALPFCEFHGAIVKIAALPKSCFPIAHGLKPIGVDLIKPCKAWRSMDGPKPREILSTWPVLPNQSPLAAGERF
jgi:hypothetical protein